MEVVRDEVSVSLLSPSTSAHGATGEARLLRAAVFRVRDGRSGRWMREVVA